MSGLSALDDALANTLEHRGCISGIAGVVVSGAVRDLARIEARRFPVFHRGVGPRPATKSHAGELGTSVSIGGQSVAPGDLIVGDADGIVVVPTRFVSDVLADVALLHHREAELRRAVESGISTLDALGLQ